ncbi:MAG: tetratricopeptide repeat protein [Planctomycetota bacterium]
MRDLVTKTGTRGRVLNPKAALIVAIAVAATCGSLRKLHDRQFAATLTFLRDSAFSQLEKKDFRAARKQFAQYLAIGHSDPDARERLSWILSEQIQTRSALEEAHRHNEDLLRSGFGDDSLRLRQARVASRLGEMSDAEAHLKMLRSTQVENSEVWFLSGRCAEATRDLKAAGDYYKRAIQCSSPQPEAFTALAAMADPQTPSEFNAETMLADLVRRCPSAQAWSMRADYHFDRGQYRDAINDAWKAIELSQEGTSTESAGDRTSPFDQRRLNAILAISLQQPGVNSATSADIEAHLRRACQYFAALVSATPADPEPRLYLTAIFQKLGQRDNAMQTLEDGIQHNPRAFLLHTTLIDLLIESGDVAHAIRLLDSIPKGSLPRDATAYCRGRILMAEKNWKDAISSFEEAIGFTSRGSGLLSRAQLSLALCRNHTSDASSALESFRTVVAENPNSLPARLGMAAAWVRAGQTDLAIAEYRGLVHVPGVAPYLVDLLIQRNADQPASLRNWTEVDQLLREDQPTITDPVQRVLLRADRLFASGDIMAAINTLENAQARDSSQPQLVAAIARIHGTYGELLRQRLETMTLEQPENPSAYAALIRQHLLIPASEDPHSDAYVTTQQMIDDIVSGSRPATAGLSEQARLLLAIEVLEIVMTLERRIGRNRWNDLLENTTIRLSRRLADRDPAFESHLISSLVRSGRTRDAFAFLKESGTSGQPEHRGDAIVELVRSSADRDSVLPEATALMYEFIRSHPENVPLRLHYADLMLFASQYDPAEQTLKPLAKMAGHEAQVAVRRAWLRAAQLKNLDEAIKIANDAVDFSGGAVSSKEALARVFLAKRQFEDALRELESAGSERLSLNGQIYRIAALLNLNRESEATVAMESIHVSDSDRLFPADRDLLVALSQRLRMPSTKDLQDTSKPARSAMSGEEEL